MAAQMLHYTIKQNSVLLFVYFYVGVLVNTFLRRYLSLTILMRLQYSCYVYNIDKIMNV